MFCCMGRKHKSYIREWRQKKGYTQKQVVEQLAERAGDTPAEDPTLRIPRTEASLSRIESGKQNFTMATLEALAEVLEADEPGWLLDRNPLKAGEVISMIERLTDDQAAQAAAVLRAMFASAG